MMIRIIIADDHRMMREGLRALLQRLPKMSVIAEAENGRDAVEMSQRLTPDVVVMDIAMPDMNGIEATRLLTSNGNNHIKVIALSGRATARVAADMLDAGASAFVRKESAFNELEEALTSVMENKIYLSPAIADNLIAERAKERSTLSAREREVLQLIAEGMATKEIARHLHLSIKTIETHRRNLMEKLKVFSVAELTKYAIREGVTTADM